MSGQIYEVGSVISFWPDLASRDSGTALVVVKREQWVIHTELRRVMLVRGRFEFNYPLWRNGQSDEPAPDITLSDRHPGEGPPAGP